MVYANLNCLTLKNYPCRYASVSKTWKSKQLTFSWWSSHYCANLSSQGCRWLYTKSLWQRCSEIQGLNFYFKRYFLTYSFHFKFNRKAKSLMSCRWTLQASGEVLPMDESVTSDLPALKFCWTKCQSQTTSQVEIRRTLVQPQLMNFSWGLDLENTLPFLCLMGALICWV